VTDIAAGEQIYHDPFCRCGHKKGLHSGYEADGRCVNRSCGCGRYEPSQPSAPASDAEEEWSAAEAGSAVAAALDQLGQEPGPWHLSGSALDRIRRLEELDEWDE